MCMDLVREPIVGILGYANIEFPFLLCWITVVYHRTFSHLAQLRAFRSFRYAKSFSMHVALIILLTRRRHPVEVEWGLQMQTCQDYCDTRPSSLSA